MLSCKNLPCFVLLALLALGMPSPAAAQHFSVGMKTGVATLNPLSTSGIFVGQPHSLIWGPVAEVGLPYHSGIEVSALHRQITYRWQDSVFLTLCPYCITNQPFLYEQQETRAHSWEVPLVLKKYVEIGPQVHFFGDLGFAIRHTASTTHAHGIIYETRDIPPPPYFAQLGTFSENIRTPELVRRTRRNFEVSLTS